MNLLARTWTTSTGSTVDELQPTLLREDLSARPRV
jgi:hypothetical protein